MDQLFTFSSNHPFLVGAILVVSIMLVNSFFAEKLRGYSSVSPAESTLLINREDALMLDVREMNEYTGGHIVNAVHIPLSNLKTRLTELDQYKDKKVIVSCRSGHRSGNACSSLKKAGFTDVFNLRGGVMAWQNANLPLVK